MHKKHNERQIEHGKIAVTESVARDLKKKKMIDDSAVSHKDMASQNRFAKAILSR